MMTNRLPLDLSLYLILDPDRCGGITGMVDTAIQAVNQGVTVVQLRAESNWKKRQWYEAALALKQALLPLRIPLIINDQIDIALAVDADGVHIGQNDLPASVARRLLGPDKWIGLSISNQRQLEQVPFNLIDYLGIGPVFPTTSKPDADPAFGINQLKQLADRISCPCVAIGGISIDSVADVMSTGVNGIAVVSAICGQPDPAYASQLLRQQLEAR